MKLKICGLSRPSEVETCINNGVDFCGFILNFPKSHRYINNELANKLTNLDKKKSKFVGVLVQPSKKELEKFSKLNLDYFQLYGNYNDDQIFQIKKDFNKKIIATIQVKNKEDVQNYEKVKNSADIILWDSSGYEKSLSWDYNLIKSIPFNGKKMIAGNITIQKLKDLINLADIVDVSGALETNKVKDIRKIEEFVKEIKKINNEN